MMKTFAKHKKRKDEIVIIEKLTVGSDAKNAPTSCLTASVCKVWLPHELFCVVLSLSRQALKL